MKKTIISGCLLLAALGCDGMGAQAAKSAQASKPARAVDLEAHLQAAQKADTIKDAEQRCLAYPDAPGVTWDRKLVEARCALARAPIFSEPDIARLVTSRDGREELDRRYRALLNAHHADPAQRDQIFVSTAIFRDDPYTTDSATAWVKSEPESAFANLAAGLRLLGQAQTARGEQSARATSEYRMQNMAELAAQAAQYLQKAHALEPRLTPACVALASVQRMAMDSELAQATAAQCVTRDPASYFVVMEWMSVQAPKWGGSIEGLQKVLEHIDVHRKSNPVLPSITAAVLTDPYTQLGEEQLPAYLEELEKVASIGPNAYLLNLISAAYYGKGDQDRGMAYLSQAVRFNVGASAYRAIRAEKNRITRPDWALADFNAILEHDPTSLYAQYQAKEAARFVEMRKAGTLPKPGEPISLGDAFYKMTKLTDCERLNSVGDADDFTKACADRVIAEWPEDADAWRVRAYVLHWQHRPEAREAAEKYLQIGDRSAAEYRIHERNFRQWKSEAAPAKR